MVSCCDLNLITLLWLSLNPCFMVLERNVWLLESSDKRIHHLVAQSMKKQRWKICGKKSLPNLNFGWLEFAKKCIQLYRGHKTDCSVFTQKIGQPNVLKLSNVAPPSFPQYDDSLNFVYQQPLLVQLISFLYLSFFIVMFVLLPITNKNLSPFLDKWLL